VAARNILVDEHFRVRVADFGFARLKEKGRSMSAGYTSSDLGPVKWSAPEAIRRRRYSEKSDVFSFGVLL
jgi:serine/threonine protein kinase